MIEKVKKILEKYKVWVLNFNHGQGERFNQEDAAQQICQLFEPEDALGLGKPMLYKPNVTGTQYRSVGPMETLELELKNGMYHGEPKPDGFPTPKELEVSEFQVAKEYNRVTEKIIEEMRKPQGVPEVKTFTASREPKPDDEGLLTDEEMLNAINPIPGRALGEDYSRLTIAIMETIAKAQRDLTASIKDARYRQAVKDSIAGKELDLTEEEFEIFCSIENHFIEKASKVEGAECEAKIRNEVKRQHRKRVLLVEYYSMRLDKKDTECQEKCKKAYKEGYDEGYSNGSP